MGGTRESILSRFFDRQRPAWVTISLGVLFFLIPVIAVSLDGYLNETLRKGTWRPLLLPPAIITYILTIGPIMARSSADIFKSFRPIVVIEDEEFDRLVKQASRVDPFGEIIVFGLGAALGFWQSQQWQQGATTLWIGLYLDMSLSLMYGLLAWVVFNSFALTRLTNELHRQKLQFDLFDTRPFSPIGQQSFVLGLVFFGGILLSMFFGINLENILSWQTWGFYIPLAVVPVLIFFLNMLPTHRVLLAEKQRQLKVVQQVVKRANLRIRQAIQENDSIAPFAAEYSALSAFENRLEAARTWPYDTPMFRVLLFTILIPLLMRTVTYFLFDR